MALYNAKHTYLQFPLFLAIRKFQFGVFRISLILVNICSANSISFNITCFNNNNDILYQGDASAGDHVIQLTGGSQALMNISGRAMYKEPMRLWDNATGKLTDFSTTFSFSVDTGNKYLPGGGLSFFLIPNGSFILPNSSDGFLGLAAGNDQKTSTKSHFVAVEFENYHDLKGPGLEHVGIIINSLSSGENYRGWSRSTAKKRFNMLVEYNSSTNNLCATLIDLANNAALSRDSNLCSKVDLKDYLPECVTVGFLATTREFSRKYSIYSWQFNSSLKVSEAETNNTDCKEDKKISNGLAMGIVVGACGAFVLIGAFVFLWFMLYRKRNGGRENNCVIINDFLTIVDNSFDDELARSAGSWPKRFSYCELEQATNNFAEEGKLGRGGFGDVYRGFLSSLNLDIAVKRISKGSRQGKKEYKTEVMIISSLRHRNLVQLMGWCHERDEFLLVYEFMPNGSLDCYLFSPNRMLSWGIRYKIVVGLASALLYLHEGWEQCVVHRDIKSSNVMLDISFNTKLGDFGLARLIDHELGPKTTGLAGTFGYIAPEYISTGKASKETDMYSFGVVILEIACGRRAIQPEIDDLQATLVAWVWDLYGRESLLDAADQRLYGDFDMEQLKRLMMLGLWCAHPDHRLRPYIRQAVQVLNYEAEIPHLPMQMPVAIYHVPNSSTSSSEPFMTSTSTNLGR